MGFSGEYMKESRSGVEVDKGEIQGSKNRYSGHALAD